MARITRLWLAVLLLAGTGTALAQSANRDSECLRAALMQYMRAVVENEPESPGIIVGFRQTENAVVTQPGTQGSPAADGPGTDFYDPPNLIANPPPEEDNGLIPRVYAAMFYPAQSQPIPNRPPYEGIFSAACDLRRGAIARTLRR